MIQETQAKLPVLDVATKGFVKDLAHKLPGPLILKQKSNSLNTKWAT
jgi:hypothetical protein